MKPMTVAALSLLGWYLVVPPRLGDNLVTDAPLALYPHLDSFDSADACREAALRMQRHYERDPKNSKVKIEQYQAWECIASDDPRLKDSGSSSTPKK